MLCSWCPQDYRTPGVGQEQGGSGQAWEACLGLWKGQSKVLITERKAPRAKIRHVPWRLMLGLAGNWFLDTGFVTPSLRLELSEPHPFPPLWLSMEHTSG